MSNRLKRKLGEQGVDLASSRANESFCLIGTPLPPLEKSKDSGEFVPLWKQEVRDEKGRRRLHGAFTGGFSAGYFNSVGSKEGWAPQEFVSSRSSRAKQKTARPEDFMDEEDLAELKDSQKIVDEADEMDITGGTQGKVLKRGGDDPEQDSSITSALQASMLPPPSDSVGARILKKMGWRVGQGIGPRLSYRQRKLQDLQATSTRELTLDDVLDDDPEAGKHTYAPRDTPILLVGRKDNFHGLGYRPGMSLNEGLGAREKKEMGPTLSAGFGLGALNDAEDDDVDIYDKSLSRGNRTAYDASDDADERILLGSSRPSKPPRGRDHAQAPLVSGSFRDGRPVLAGFVVADSPVAEDRWFPLPEVPKGWTPNPQRVWEKDKENKATEKQVLPSVQPHEKWKKGISADERGDMLGETRLPGKPRSVFDYMSQKDRERLQNIATGQPATPTAPGSLPTSAPAGAIVIPTTDRHIAQAALRGFQPFTSDPAKQARYTAYLQTQASPDMMIELVPLPGQRIDEFNKELADYAKAAQLFKPVSGAMAGRFTSAAVVEHGPTVVGGLHTPSASDAKEEKPQEKEVKEEESPKAHAARMGMYGPMTRETVPWQPARLLCKRFGVKDPNPEPAPDVSGAQSAGPGAAPVPDVGLFSADASFRGPQGQAVGLVRKKDGGPRDVNNVGLGEDDEQGRDTLTYERPSMDIFKAIFASDDEDSGDEDGDGDVKMKVEEPQMPAVAAAPIPSPSVGVPATPVPPPVKDEKVDLNTFRPTFVPRSERTTKATDKDKDKTRDKKDKKKKGKVLVSFEVDGEQEVDEAPRERKKKKKRREEAEAGEDKDDDMWVEKPPPEAVMAISGGVPPPSAPTVVSPPSDEGRAHTSGRERKRAVDFM